MNDKSNINISNSPISKTKYNNLYEKKKIEINDNNYNHNEKDKNKINNNLSREKSEGIIPNPQSPNKLFK